MPNIIEEFQFIKTIIRNRIYSKSDIILLFQQSDIHSKFIFSQLNNISDSFKWFKILKSGNVFDFSSNSVNSIGPSSTIKFLDPLAFLERVALENYNNSNDRSVWKLILEIIDTYLQNPENKFIGDQIINRYISLIIFYLPIEYVNEDHISFVEKIGLNADRYIISNRLTANLLPRLLETPSIVKYNTLLFRLLDIYFSYDNSTRSDGKVSQIEQFQLKEVFEKKSSEIFNRLGIKIIEYCTHRLIKLYNENPLRFSSFYITSIAEDSQNQFIDDFESIIVFFIRDLSLSVKKHEDIIDVLGFFESNNPLLKRFYYFFINKNYEILNKQFWLSTNNPLDDSESKLELFNLFKDHANSFTNSEVRIFLDWVGHIKIDDEYFGSGEDFNQYMDAVQLEWLEILIKNRNSKSPSILFKKFDQLAKSTYYKSSHPGYNSYMEISRLESPIIFDLLLLENSFEVSAYINSLIISDIFIRKDLEEQFLNYISINLEKEKFDLNPFLNLPDNFQSQIISAYQSAWRNSISIDWQKILKFIENLSNSADFWVKVNDKSSSMWWIVDLSSWLVKDGCSKDEHSFDILYVPLSQSILLNFAYNTNSNLVLKDDPLTEVINSTKGKIYEALILLSLFNARKNNENEDFRWLKDTKEFFTYKIEDPEREIEFYHIIGMYLPQIGYLSLPWIKTNLNKIFSITNDDWIYPFIGYLQYPRKVYKDLFQLLVDYYAMAIFKFNSVDIKTERLIHHLCVFDNAGWRFEDRNIELMDLVFSNRNFTQISYIIRYFLKAEIKDANLIKPMWSKLIKVSSFFDPKDQVTFKVDLMRLLELDLELDDEYVFLIERSIPPYQEGKYAFNRIFWALMNKVDKYPLIAGRLFLLMINTYNYDRAVNLVQLKNFIDNIYKVDRDLANKICILLIEMGHVYVFDYYEINNKIDLISNDNII